MHPPLGHLRGVYLAQPPRQRQSVILIVDRGIALILGLFTGLAAFGGSLLNWSFVMAGTASTNMLMFGVTVLLILAWKTAGWYGLDRWILPLLGTPWTPGRLRSDGHEAQSPVRPPAPA